MSITNSHSIGCTCVLCHATRYPLPVFYEKEPKMTTSKEAEFDYSEADAAFINSGAPYSTAAIAGWRNAWRNRTEFYTKAPSQLPEEVAKAVSQLSAWAGITGCATGGWDMPAEATKRLQYICSTASILIQSFAAERERAFQMLELYGVPRERAKSVSNGIDVLMARMRKERDALQRQIEEARNIIEELEPWFEYDPAGVLTERLKRFKDSA